MTHARSRRLEAGAVRGRPTLRALARRQHPTFPTASRSTCSRRFRSRVVSVGGRGEVVNGTASSCRAPDAPRPAAIGSARLGIDGWRRLRGATSGRITAPGSLAALAVLVAAPYRFLPHVAERRQQLGPRCRRHSFGDGPQLVLRPRVSTLPPSGTPRWRCWRPGGSAAARRRRSTSTSVIRSGPRSWWSSRRPRPQARPLRLRVRPTRQSPTLRQSIESSAICKDRCATTPRR